MERHPLSRRSTNFKTGEGTGHRASARDRAGGLGGGGNPALGGPRRLGGAAGALLGIAGIALLILLGWAVGQEARARVQPNAREFIEVAWEVGAWVVAGLLAGASLHGLYRVVRREPPADMLPS